MKITEAKIDPLKISKVHEKHSLSKAKNLRPTCKKKVESRKKLTALI